jgi:hypothetical protein
MYEKNESKFLLDTITLWRFYPNSRTKDGNSLFYHGRVYTGTGTTLVLICIDILPILRSSEEIACDANFATLPFLFAQLFKSTLLPMHM